jgi:eukaryotic-like serine/threonine-protein kinase
VLAIPLHQTLGRAYLATGAYAKAEKQLQAASALLHLTAPANDERTVLADYELAAALGRVSQFAQATALMDRADARAGAALRRSSALALHSNLARGDLLYQQMKVAEALVAYRHAELILRAVSPDDAVTAAHILLSIAGCDLRLNRAPEAERIARSILTGAPYTQARVGLSMLALARSRLGDALRAEGRFDDAIAVLSRAVADYRGIEGPNGQGTLTALSSLGYVYSLEGDVRHALDVQRAVYQGNLARWGERSQYTLVELLNLGSAEYDAGDLRAALRHLQAADRGLVQVSGAHSPTVQAARVAEANALNSMGNPAAALTLLEKVDPAAYQATTSDPGRAWVLKAIHAQILLALPRRAEGLAELREAIAGMRAAGVSAEELKTYTDVLRKASSA